MSSIRLWRDKTRKAPALIWLLLVAALMTRALLPSGWMPTVDAGGVRIAICSGAGPEFLILERDGHLRKQTPSPESPHDPCPFGLAIAPLLDAGPNNLELFPQITAETPDHLPMLVKVNIIRRSLRPPSRAPPEFA